MTTRPRATKLGKKVPYYEKFQPVSRTTLGTRDHVMLRDKLKMLYLYYRNANGDQTRHGGNQTQIKYIKSLLPQDLWT